MLHMKKSSSTSNIILKVFLILFLLLVIIIGIILYTIATFGIRGTVTDLQDNKVAYFEIKELIKYNNLRVYSDEYEYVLNEGSIETIKGREEHLKPEEDSFTFIKRVVFEPKGKIPVRAEAIQESDVYNTKAILFTESGSPAYYLYLDFVKGGL